MLAKDPQFYIRIIIAALVIICLVRFTVYLLGVNRMNVTQRYRQAAVEYLEEKYGESFHVDTRWRDTRDAGPIPNFDFPPVCYYLAYPLADEDYVFKVFITREEDSYKIEKIRDNYCWRSMIKQLQQYTIDNLSGVFGEMKVYSELSYYYSFPYDLSNSSTLDDFFTSEGISTFYMDIYLPTRLESLTSEEIEETLANFMTGLMNKTGIFSKASNIAIWNPENQEQYDLIDTSMEEEVLMNRSLINSRMYDSSVEPFWYDRKKLNLIYSMTFRNAIEFMGGDGNEFID